MRAIRSAPDGIDRRQDRDAGTREDQPGRPRFLDLRRLTYPPGAIASICHRASGALLAIAMPVAAVAFVCSLASAEGYAQIVTLMRMLPVRIVLALLIAALAFHLLAGLRHLLMDAGIGNSLRAGRASAWAVIAAGAAALVVAAVGLMR